MKYVQIDETKSSDIGLRVRGYSRPSFAENRDVFATIDGREGSKHYPQPDGMYSFNVVFRCHFEDEQERINKLEDISNFLYTEEMVRIVQSDMPNRYRLGKVSNFVDYTPSFNTLEIDVEFITEPYSYDNDETVEVKDYNSEEAEHEQVIEDLGLVTSEFELTIELKSNVNELRINVGNSELFIDHSIGSNEMVRIDTNTFNVDKIKLTGGQVTTIQSLILDVYGEFPTLSKKSSRLTISSSSAFKCKTTLSYRKRYLL